MDSLISPSKISNLTQGMFVGAVVDELQRIKDDLDLCHLLSKQE
jgi:hypothetical protein